MRLLLLVLADSAPHLCVFWGCVNLVNDVAFTSEVAPFGFTAFGPSEQMPDPPSIIGHPQSKAGQKPCCLPSFHAGDVQHPCSLLSVLADGHFKPWGYENLVNDIAFTLEAAPFEFTTFSPFEWLPNPLLVVIGPRRDNASLQTVLLHSCPLLSFLANVKNGCTLRVTIGQ